MKCAVNIRFETAVSEEDEVRGLIARCAQTVLESEQTPFDAAIDVTVVDGARIQEINREFRGIDRVTDVLSFPMYEFYNGVPQETLEQDGDGGSVMLGDMVLCYDRAREQAAEFGHSVARECGYLTTHSVLHLLGYDHERNDEDTRLMRRKEEENLKKNGLERE